VKSVHEAKLPEVDEAFAKSLGVADGDVARLRDEVRTNLAREAKRRVQAKIKEQVLNGLLETFADRRAEQSGRDGEPGADGKAVAI
jgi:trigger factor